MSFFVNIHTHQYTNKSVKEVRNLTIQEFNIDNLELKNLSYYSIGIHPWYIDESALETHLKLMILNMDDIRFVMIGECGLDKVCKSNFELQKKVFQLQIQLSEKYHKPLIIHCVQAYNEVILIKKTMHPKQPWIIHGFNKKVTILRDLIKNDFYISIGAAIFSSKTFTESLKEIPMDRLLFENDDKEIDIALIFAEASNILGMDIEILKLQVYENFNKIIGKNG